MKISNFATAFALYASTSTLVLATPIEERSLSCSAQSGTVVTIRNKEDKPVDFCYLYLNGATKNPFSKLKASAVSSACSCVTKSATTATRTHTVTDKVTEIITRSKTKTSTVYRTQKTTTTVKVPHTIIKSTTVKIPQTVVRSTTATTTVTAPGKNSVSTVTKQVPSVSTVTKQIPSGYTTTVTKQVPSGYTTTLKSSVTKLITVTTSALAQITSTVTQHVIAEPSTTTISVEVSAKPQTQTVTSIITIQPSCAASSVLNATALSNSTVSASSTSIASSISTASPSIISSNSTTSSNSTFSSNSTIPSNSTASTSATSSSCTSHSSPIVDPTFSNGLDSWGTHVQDGQVISSSAYGGKTAAELTCDASNDGPYDRSFVYQIFNTCPGTKYSVSWAYYLATAGSYHNSYLYMYDNEYSGDPTAGSIISGVSTNSATQSQWTYLDATFTAEGNSTLLGVTLICAGNDHGTQMLVTDIVATIVD